MEYGDGETSPFPPMGLLLSRCYKDRWERTGYSVHQNQAKYSVCEFCLRKLISGILSEIWSNLKVQIVGVKSVEIFLYISEVRIPWLESCNIRFQLLNFFLYFLKVDIFRQIAS